MHWLNFQAVSIARSIIDAIRFAKVAFFRGAKSDDKTLIDRTIPELSNHLNRKIEMFAKRLPMTTLIAFLSLTAIGSAHPGHGGHFEGNSVLHYATSPMHWIPFLMAATLVAFLAWSIRRGASSIKSDA